MTLLQAATSVPHYAAATGGFKLIWLLIALPLFGAAVLLLGGKRTNKWGHLLATALSAAAFVVAVILFFALKGRAGDNRAISETLFSWIPVNGFNVQAGLLLDQLSGLFILLITGVGTLIHIYSIGYMAHDPGRRRFFAYLNLFMASMLLLVLGNSYLALYVGWEMVGLSSYLLIQFWVYKPVAATAANKAFYFNRVGDVGLSIAIMLMFATTGSTSFAQVFGAAGTTLTHATLTALGLLLLLGACGKSGQFPLQGWLPDAMEGPTPVSALIHAATMVTAGVYLIARSSPIFDGTQAARTVVLIVGAITLLYGCIIGCAYDDIKKVFAYSTVSQIGYMFVAVGLGPAGYALGIMHLLAHGFFKAGLFLGAGSVMHAMDDTVDARRFGGLWKVMPITWVCTGLGYLAIIGCPPFSGFFTKDKIIEAAFDKGGTSGALLGTVALLGAGLTAFYMTRIFVMTFHGKRRWKPEFHPHESPKTMTIPMMVLAVGSVFAGGLMVLGGSVQHWLTPVLGKSVEEGVHTISPIVLTLLTLLVVIGGVAGAYFRYQIRPVAVLQPTQVTVATRAARANLYTDAANEAVLMRPGQWFTRVLVFVDNNVIDGAVRGLAAGIGGLSGRMRRTQNGFVRSYALSMLGGAVLLAGALLLVRIGVSSVPWLTILLIIPAAGALVVAAIPKTNPLLAKQTALAVSLVELGFTIAMIVDFKDNKPGYQFFQKYSWIKAFGVHYEVGVDGIALVLIGLAALLVPVVLIASWDEVDQVEASGKRSVGGYFALILALQTGMVGVFASLDVFLFYVFFEAILIPMYFIIGSYGGPQRQYASVKFLLYSLFGGLIMLAAVIGLYVVSTHHGAGTFDFIALRGMSMASSTEKLLFLGFFLAFAIKAPLFPFHTWLPDAGAEAPIGGAVLLVGVLDKIGTFGLIRYCIPLFPNASKYYAPLVLALAVAGIFYGALLAIGQRDMKRLVSYTSLAHFGFIALGTFALTTQGGTGAVLYMFNHGLSTGALFLCVGFLIARRGTRDIDGYRGMFQVTPKLAGVMLIAGLSALSLPGLSTFVSEFLVLVGTFTRYRALAIVATVGIVLAAIYVLYLIQRTLTGPRPAWATAGVDGDPPSPETAAYLELTSQLGSKPGVHGSNDPDLSLGEPVTPGGVRRRGPVKDLSWREGIALAPLLGLIVVLGVYPKPILDIIRPAVNATIHDIRPAGDPAPTEVSSGAH